MQLISLFVTLLRLCAVLLPIAAALLWFWLEGSVHFAFERVCRDITPELVGFGTRGIGALIGSAHAALLSYAILNLARFISEGEQGQYLSNLAVICFRRFAISALIYELSAPVVSILASQLLTNGVAIVLNTDDLKLLGGAIALLAVSHVLGIAREAKDENESFL